MFGLIKCWRLASDRYVSRAIVATDCWLVLELWLEKNLYLRDTRCPGLCIHRRDVLCLPLKELVSCVQGKVVVHWTLKPWTKKRCRKLSQNHSRSQSTFTHTAVVISPSGLKSQGSNYEDKQRVDTYRQLSRRAFGENPDSIHRCQNFPRDSSMLLSVMSVRAI